MDHAAKHGQVHRVACVEDFPLGTEPGFDQHVMRAGELQEQDVHEERCTTDFFGQRFGAKGYGGDRVPDRDVDSDVDLLR